MSLLDNPEEINPQCIETECINDNIKVIFTQQDNTNKSIICKQDQIGQKIPLFIDDTEYLITCPNIDQYCLQFPCKNGGQMKFNR